VYGVNSPLATIVGSSVAQEETRAAVSGALARLTLLEKNILCSCYSQKVVAGA